MVLMTLVAANAMLIFVNGARNAVALWVMAGAMGLVVLGVYVPWLAAPLYLAPLDVAQVMAALGLGVVSIVTAWICLRLLRYDGPFKGAQHGRYQPNQQ
jgi:magnesium-transporting ATPase (P-type)